MDTLRSVQAALLQIARHVSEVCVCVVLALLHVGLFT